MDTDFAVKRFMARCRAKRLAPATVAAYEWALGEFARAYPGALPEEPDDVEDYLAGLDRLSLRSQWNVWRMLRTAYGYWEKRLKVPNAAAAVEGPRLPKQPPKALTQSQVHTLLAQPLCRRDRAIICLLLDSGLRLGEIAKLRREDVHEEAIAVEGKTGVHYVPAGPTARAALVGVDLPWQDDHGRPLTRSGVYQLVRRAMRRAGIKSGGPHRLRHTFAVHYVLAGGDFASLQAILGHTNPASTYIYTRLPRVDIQRQHAKFSQLLAPSG